ncbi:aspartate kinase [Desulfonispora thiosulfatigenes DSM 11270]|uniref:Aspartokinase n=1 Tax=Desulfonispora thiosulfatigenes DSM 11270 TaxID=656914 RepID=A0A1W1VMI6_DESTI|nr:aspartate kinase [Desulfonispora thiosulfatigenes]SMB94538.1 aspartate kinase [Desulfonispora thiosulfatigenes DSM 11270]
MKLIVQKFGGTSVSTKENRDLVAKKITSAKQEGYGVIVVVSAMGRKGDPYATDTLMSFVRNNSSEEVNPRELDLLLSCGEVISAVLLSEVLKTKGHEAIVLNGAQAGIITDDSFNNAKILKVKPEKIYNYLNDNKIVIVTGFQGVTEDGEMTTLGRGGSDTTAAALGVAVDAEFVDIYTDVDGIKTADPRIVKDAKTLDVITYTEICNLAHEGARVIHPRAVQIAMQKDIPLRIKCTFSDNPGTLVNNLGKRSNTVEIFGDRIITGIAHVANVTQLKISIDNQDRDKNTQLSLFNTLASNRISVDFININPDRIIFTVQENQTKNAIKLIENLGIKVNALVGCAKISSIGANMAGVPGVMASIVDSLTNEDIEILQTADSHTTIWCLVHGKDMENAVIALHNKFKLS